MPALTSTELRKGTVFKENAKVYRVIDYKHVKKGRGLATVRVKVKDVNSKAIVEKTFSSNEKVESVNLEHKSAQYLYADDENSYFMDSDDYTQFEVPSKFLKEESNFLMEGMKVDISWLEGEVVEIQLPKKVSVKVKYTEPAVVGDTASGATKEAELETGYKLQVPLFIQIGDKVVVNTESCEYVSKG